jgi:hypothetical protein
LGARVASVLFQKFVTNFAGLDAPGGVAPPRNIPDMPTSARLATGADRSPKLATNFWNRTLVRPRAQSVLVAVVCAALLYLPWRSIQFDLNGIIEAASVDAGGASVLSPNHLLFRPLGLAILALLRAGGYAGHSLGLLQIISALCGAMAVGFAVLAYRRLGAQPSAAAMAGALIATSWAHWVFSTDVHYVTLAAMLAAAALAVAATASTASRAAAAGLLSALATLAWQANVFLLPALALGIARTMPAAARRRAVGVFLGSGALAVLAGYLICARAAGAADELSAFLRWSTSYGGGSTRLPIYGAWAPARLPTAAASWIASMVSVWDGLGLRALAQGRLQADKILPQLSLVALAVLTVVPAARLLRRSHRDPASFVVGWMLAAFALYLPFIVWWEPFNPRWFIVPNLFLAGALAALWSGRNGLAWLCVAVIAVANFTASAWPRHTQPNPLLSRAQCIVEHLQPADVFLVSDWEWFGYATYFYAYPGSSDWLLDRRGRDAKLGDIARHLEEAARRGGRVYMLDVRGYSEARAAWLLQQTELTLDDFTRFAPRPAFACGDAEIVELQGP